MLHERERGLFIRFSQKMPKGSQMIAALFDRYLTDFFQLVIRIVMRQRNKADEDSDAWNPSFLKHRLCPEVAPWTDELCPMKMIFRSPFHAGNLFLRNMLRVGAEVSRFKSAVDGDLFHFAIEDANEFTVVANPDLESGILRRYGIIGFFYFDMSVPMNRSLAFMKEGE